MTKLTSTQLYALQTNFEQATALLERGLGEVKQLTLVGPRSSSRSTILQPESSAFAKERYGLVSF